MEVNSDKVIEQIQLAKEGKQSAFNFLLDRFWTEVYHFQLKRVRNEYEAEDITIETFARAFDRIHTFDEQYNFSTWLMTISKNIQIDKFRKKNITLSGTLDTSKEQIKKIKDDAPTPEDHLIREQNLKELLRNIKKLQPHYQEVIHLRYFQEMSYNEISEKLDESLSTVKVRLLRARKLLAEVIREI